MDRWDKLITEYPNFLQIGSEPTPEQLPRSAPAEQNLEGHWQKHCDKCPELSSDLARQGELQENLEFGIHQDSTNQGRLSINEKTSLSLCLMEETQKHTYCVTGGSKEQVANLTLVCGSRTLRWCI
jgi:hypothetical protein